LITALGAFMKKFTHLLLIVSMLLSVYAKSTFAHQARETIFDKIITIPKELVLDIPYLPLLCDEITDLKQGFIEIKNGKLYYEEEGSGIPLVLINGGPGGTHHVFHPYFSQIKDLARIIYYDQRGTGKSSKDDTGETYTIKQAVEDLETLRKALKIEKWAVLGWSYGGFLAQCYALTYPEHVVGLILVTATDGLTKVKMQPGRGQMFLSKEEREAIRKIRAAEDKGTLSLIQDIYNADLAGDWKRQNYYKPTLAKFIRAALYEWSPAPGFRALIGSDEQKMSLDGKFNDFEVPTLITEAKWDLTWGADKAKLIHKNHPHAQFEYFKKSGHCVFADEPEKFFPLLKKFLAKANNTRITYKSGNRLQWPQPVPEIIRKLFTIDESISKKEQAKKILGVYIQAVNEDIKDARTWNTLGNYFLGIKKHPKECLDALQKYETFIKIQNPEEFEQYGHCIKTQQGQMLDLLGKRNEAIKCYQEALQKFKGSCGDVDQKWLEEHIKNASQVNLIRSDLLV